MLAAEYAGPFAPHKGMQISTVFANEFGRDADATLVVDAVRADRISVSYASTRGLAVKRDILISDRKDAYTYVLGYAARMPAVIEGSTSLGISQAVLRDLRANGRAYLKLVYSDRLDAIGCDLVTTGIDVKVPVIVEDRIFEVPTIQTRAVCGSGSRRGRGQLVFVNDLANPVLVESYLDFSWEKQPRSERVTRVVAGLGLQSEMVQSLSTLGAYDVYGLHFDFDSASLRPETAQLVREIAQMLEENPKWVLQIAGHTDSIGGQAYNETLSLKRAQAIRTALINAGVRPKRLVAVGYGMDRPKADNSTMVGRAINRRVEFRRLDR
jgi:outer membrane protein OmpA-like peptidoglycan-associated protein